ncbi:MAG: MFS transporter [Hyphomonadaceae bacterium]
MSEDIQAAAAQATAAPRRLFANPWWIVFGSALALTVAGAPITLFTYGLFMKPLSAEFGWDREALSAVSAVSSVCGAATAPLIGWGIDKWGVRRVLAPVVLLFGIFVAALSLTQSLAMFFVIYALAAAASSGQGPLGYVKSISAFFDAHRGLALGLAVAGIGVGATLVPQYAQWLIAEFGWRAAYVGLGVLLIVIAVPSVLIFVREPSEAAAGGDPEALPGFGVREALFSWRFWSLAVSFFCVSAVVNGMVVHLSPYLTDNGFSAAASAQLVGAIGLSTLAGRLVSGYLLDRLYAPAVAAVFFAMPIGALFLLDAQLAPLAAVIGLGLASGAEVDLIGYMVSRYFGLKRFAQIYGYLFAVFALGAGFGPYLLGFSYVRLGGYQTAFWIFSGVLVLAILLVATLGRYAYPVQRRG